MGKMPTVEEELRNVGLKVTPQRAKILEYFERSPGEHYSAEDIHTYITETNPSVPPATVYNILKILVERGKINTFEINGKALYESRTDPHINFSCEACGQINDYEMGDLGRELIEKIPGRVISSGIVFKGICQNCLNSMKDDEEYREA